MPPRKQPTIRDVAAVAGVSIATVSKYVNGQQSFTRAVEDKLKAAIETLGYRQNPAARSMATGRTKAIGLAVMDIRNPHHANIVKGANRVALAAGYNLLVVDMEESSAWTRQLLEALALRADGLIVSTRIPDDATDWLTALGKPVIFVGRPTRADLVSVRTDGRTAANMLGRHLAAQGFRRVGYAGFPAAQWNAERLKGLTDAATASGFELSVFEVDGTTLEAGEKAASSVFLGANRPEVVIGCNDQVACGLMLEARAFGLAIPDDVAIAGFDNIPFGKYVTPSLTTVDMRSEEMGETAMRRTLAMIGGEEDGAGDTLLEPRLIARDSTRPTLAMRQESVSSRTVAGSSAPPQKTSSASA
jgi:LacI family transcriptional regulator